MNELKVMIVISAILAHSVSVAAISSAPPLGCESSCAKNVHDVLSGPSSYQMKIDDAERAGISVTWRSKQRKDLQPVTFTATAPVPLRHTSIHYFTPVDACHVKVTIVERASVGDNFKAYDLTARNVSCQK